MSNSYMGRVQRAWLTPFLKDSASFAVFSLGTIIGVCGIAVVADMPVFRGYFQPWLSRVVGLGLIGFGALFASVVALVNRRMAAWLLLSISPIAAVFVTWWLWHDSYNPRISVSRILLIFTVACLPLAVPGAFWITTSRAGWSPVLSLRFLPNKRSRAFGGIFLFASCALGGVLLSLYLHEIGGGECRGYPTLSVPQVPDQAVFTASLTFTGGTLRDPGFGTWSLMHVRQKFWGLPWWVPDFVIVRGFFKVEKSEYLVDVRRSQGLLTHFLPLFEIYPCCHTGPIDRAAADLRSLRDGPPKSGARIIGTVYTDMYVTSEPARNVKVTVVGPNGSTSTTTDQEGIYDLVGLPQGHYSVAVHSDDYFFHEAECDLKPGQVWGFTLIARPAQTSAR